MKLIPIVLFAAASLMAQSAAPAVQPVQPAKPAGDTYGFSLGTVGGTARFGIMHETGVGVTGIHPAVEGGFDIGLHKYLGLFGQAGWSHLSGNASACYGYYCASASAKVNYYELGGGLEVVATNRSRVVPYGKFGAAYVGATAKGYVVSGGYRASGSGYASAPAVLFGGGVRTYVNHHFGLDAGVTALRTVGNYGGSTILAPTVGVFFQSK